MLIFTVRSMSCEYSNGIVAEVYVSGVIVVTGTRWRINEDAQGAGVIGVSEGSGMEPHPTLGPADGGGGEYEVPAPADTSDCFDEPPEGVDPVALNVAALRATEAIKRENETNYEWGVFIYRLDGQIRWTVPFTQYSESTIGWDVSKLPAGAEILATVHNHPGDDRVSGAPGTDDRYAHQVLAGGSFINGITGNANLVTYIYGNRARKTYAYDKSKIQGDLPNCPIQPE